MGFHGAGWWGYLRSSDDKPEVTWDLIKRVLKYSNPYRWQLIGMLLLILINAGLTLLTPLITRDMIDNTLPTGDLRRLIYLSIALLIIPAAGGVLSVFQRRLNAAIGEGVIYDLRIAVFSHLQRMSLRFFTNTQIGELMSRLNNDVIGAQNAISNTIVRIITNIIQAVAVLSVMLTLEWRLTLVSVIILPLFFLTARKLSGLLRSTARKHMQANAQMNALMNETLNIGGALLIKLFGRREVEENRFKERASTVRDIGVNRATLGSSFFVILGLLSAIGTALVYGLGGYFVINKTFTVGTIVAFSAYLTGLYSSLQGLGNAPVEFSTSIVSFERVFEVLDLPLEIEEKPDAKELKQIKGKLTFMDVCFKYKTDEEHLLSKVERYGRMDSVSTTLSSHQQNKRPAKTARSTQARQEALNSINFTAQPGQLVALVGRSGAGKTTLTYLIPRLYDPDEGQVMIDNLDIRDVTLDSLSAHIGMVTQETYLFHDTIRTNLLYAKPEATQEELEAAARAANIHQFISELPDGYDTIAGERGYRLSGGEKQRLALARVILKNPQILVLDEATSHLDSESEKLIQEALKKIMVGRTSIVIAHRLSTILSADLILVLDKGRIVEQGTHEELLAQDGLYAQLYQTQFSES